MHNARSRPPLPPKPISSAAVDAIRSQPAKVRENLEDEEEIAKGRKRKAMKAAKGKRNKSLRTQIAAAEDGEDTDEL